MVLRDRPDVAPLKKITDKTYSLELFHGPTLAFKDFALQLLGLLYKRQVKLSGKKLCVLGATPGSPASPATHCLMGTDRLPHVLLYSNLRPPHLPQPPPLPKTSPPAHAQGPNTQACACACACASTHTHTHTRTDTCIES